MKDQDVSIWDLFRSVLSPDSHNGSVRGPRDIRHRPSLLFSTSSLHPLCYESKKLRATACYLCIIRTDTSTYVLLLLFWSCPLQGSFASTPQQSFNRWEWKSKPNLGISRSSVATLSRTCFPCDWIFSDFSTFWVFTPNPTLQWILACGV